jgi:hypothetical protein
MLPARWKAVLAVVIAAAVDTAAAAAEAVIAAVAAVTADTKKLGIIQTGRTFSVPFFFTLDSTNLP